MLDRYSSIVSQNVRDVKTTSGPVAPRVVYRPPAPSRAPEYSSLGQLADAAPPGRAEGETIMLVTPSVIEVDDQSEGRIRKPADVLRFFVACFWILALTVAAVAASATTAGVETDITDVHRRLPHSLLVVLPPVALFALLILPAGLAVMLLARRQARRLIEAVATGVAAGVAAEAASIVLAHPAAVRLYDAITMSRPGVTHVNALDPDLAGLVAYVTMIGLTGRGGWRNASVLAVGVYAVVQPATLHSTVLSVLIALLAGRAIGVGVRYAAGSVSERPAALAIAAALAAGGDLAVTAIRRVHPSGPGADAAPGTTR